MVKITEIAPNASASPTARDASTSHSSSSYGKPRTLGLGHTIFLSHSGADKDFVKDLHAQLLANSYNAFFDAESLPKGHIVSMKNILGEARKCRLAVFVLSDDFFVRNKNPMLELAVCVKAQVQLLPLFFRLSVAEFKDRNRGKKWKEKWREWSRKRPKDADLAVNISEWKKALRILGDTNGIEYAKAGLNTGEYIYEIVKVISGLVAPDVGWDDSHVQGKERLCKVVDGMFATPSNVVQDASFVGLYGVGGVGKTTLCTALLNFYYPEFQGKVCHVELDSAPSPNEEEVVKRLKKALLDLTKVSPQLVEQVKDSAKGRDLLIKHIRDNKVFMAIDNVGTHKSIEEAESYLKTGFQTGSKILVTARSEGILAQLVRDGRFCKLAHMPDLQEREATQVFLQKAVYLRNPDPEHRPTMEPEQHSIVSQCLELCLVTKDEHPLRKEGGRRNQHHHPLMLVALAAFLGGISPNPCDWKKTLRNLAHKRKREVDDRVFTVLRSSYDALDEDEKQMFLSVALYVPENLKAHEEIYQWLRFVHEKDDFDMEKCVSAICLDMRGNVARAEVEVSLEQDLSAYRSRPLRIIQCP